MRLVACACVVVAMWSAALAGPGDEAKAANTRGMKLYFAKDYAGAAKQFRAAIASDPKYVLAHYNLASMAALLGDKPTVLAELGWLRDSKDPAAHAALAKAATDPDLHAVIDDPDVKKLLGLGDCADECDRQLHFCEDHPDACPVDTFDCNEACSLGMNADARARMRAWIDGPLTGNDNTMAHMRVATVARGEGGFGWTLYVKNQFGFKCAIVWGTDGAPAKLTACVAGVAGWRAEPAEIRLRCRVDAKHKVDRCEGAYHLLTDDNFDQDGLFAIERALR